MRTDRPILWQQGQFLQPQHFQLLDRYHESLLNPLRQYLHPYFWGVISLEIHEAALSNARFELSKGEFLFPDGELVSYPGNALLRPRSFEAEWTDFQRPFKVYLGLRRQDSQDGNVEVIDGPDELADMPKRYTSRSGPEEAGDQYGQGPVAQVRFLNYGLRLFWESELERAQNYSLLPIASLERDGGEVRVCRRYIPPCLTLSACGLLREMVRGLKDQLASRCRQLEEYKSPREVQVSALDAGYFVFLLALRSLNRYLPQLCHLLEAPHIHPWDVYGVLRQLAGEMSTFSEDLNALGERRDSTLAVSQYDHGDLWRCFSELSVLVEQLFSSISVGPEHTVRLETEGSYLSASFEPRHFQESNSYWLVLHTSTSPEEVLESVRNMAKLSAAAKITTLVAMAVPGVPLHYFPVPPPGLPRRAKSFYFRIDHESPQWGEVQRTRRVSLYWDSKPEDLAGEIVILRN
ncbi:MAG: type VI secretion system baseplate subunit TssK [Desulfocurvibacter africanus]